MTLQTAPDLSTLYEADETAWLEAMSALIERGELAELDYPHLAEYLSDMAKRDRREVKSRLKVLLAHILKWKFQPSRRTNGWRATILSQQQELQDLTESGVLHNYAIEVLPEAYAKAVELAVAETSLPAAKFPTECPYTLDQLFSPEELAE